MVLIFTILIPLLYEACLISLASLSDSYGGEGRTARRLRWGADRSADGCHAAAARHLRRHPVPQQTAQAPRITHDHPQEPVQRQDQHEGETEEKNNLLGLRPRELKITRRRGWDNDNDNVMEDGKEIEGVQIE